MRRLHWPSARSQTVLMPLSGGHTLGETGGSGPQSLGSHAEAEGGPEGGGLFPLQATRAAVAIATNRLRCRIMALQR
jgi:hypothetical protein